MSRTILYLTAAALLVASPLVGAWASKGDFEPSTLRDKTDGYMFTDPDTSVCSPASDTCATNQVYLNGFYGQCAETCSFVNPNVAAIRSEFYAADVNFQAVFGLWKDCNADGYIGIHETGLFEYRSEVLNTMQTAGVAPGTSICPAQPPMPLIKGRVAPDARPPYNDGQWVHEYIPISWRDIDASTKAGIYDTNPYDINDNKARVWMDLSLPEAEYTGSGCPQVPQERGTYANTGGMLHTYDCNAGYHVTDTFDTVADSNQTTQPFSFSDHSRDQQNSHSQLNVANPWGQQGDASFTGSMWDCNGGPVASQSLGADPVLGGSLWVNVSRPGTSPSPNTGGSLAGQMNETGSGFDECHRSTAGNGDSPQGLIFARGQNWHEGRLLATAPYVLEYDVGATPFKVQADDNFAPNIDNRPAAPFATALGPSTPADLGARGSGSAGTWSGGVQWTGDILFSTRTLAASNVTYRTFYGYTSLGKTAPLPGELAVKKANTYGKESCGGFTSGNHNGWNCASSLWYIDSLGNNINVRSTALGHDPNKAPTLACSSTQQIDLGCIEYGAKIGDPYNARDIDCYDESVQAARAQGVGYGIVTGTDCGANNN